MQQEQINQSELLACKLLKTPEKLLHIAIIIGYLISSFPGVKFGTLYYGYLEMDNIKALKQSKGNFDALVSVSKKGVADRKWWLDNLDDSYNDICHPPVDITYGVGRCHE